MYEISVEDIIRAGRDNGMRISHETASGFMGDRQVTVTCNSKCAMSQTVSALVGALSDHGDKITIFGDAKSISQAGDNPFGNVDITVSFRVDRDSISKSQKETSLNETGSDSVPDESTQDSATE